MWKTRFCEPKNYWLTFLFDTHILKTAKDDGDYPMSKNENPGDVSDLWGFLFRYVGGLCLRLFAAYLSFLSNHLQI